MSLRWSYAIVALAATAFAATVVVGPSVSAPWGDAVATVNTAVITRADYDAYANVFRNADGSLRLPSDYVLLALINQSLAVQEAERLGLRVDHASLDESTESALRLPVMAAVAQDPQGVVEFKRRLETKTLFDRVKAIVTRGIESRDADADLYVAEHADEFTGMDPHAVHDAARRLLTDRLVTEAWRTWLAEQRACATIVVLSKDISLPSAVAPATCPRHKPG